MVNRNGFADILHFAGRVVFEGILIYDKLAMADKKKWEPKALELNGERKQRTHAMQGAVLKKSATFPNCGPYGASEEVLHVFASDITVRFMC